MVAAANREGYARANVSEVIAEAGVSRPTFYDYFTDKDDCFVAAVAHAQERLLSNVSEALEERPPEQAAAAGVEAMVAFAGSEPELARFLMKETLAGDRRALDARDAAIAEIERLVERRSRRAPAEQPTPDLPTGVAIGAVQRLLASRLRRGERAVGGLLDDLLGWLAAYARPAAEHHWGTLTPAPAPPLSPFLTTAPLRPPPPLPPGRPRISEAEVVENQRQRIMFATAEVVQRRGYNATTIAEIAKLAKVDARVFYRLFADKQDAFTAIHELGFQYLMAASAGAFFTGSSWPERMWEALLAATQSVQRSPTAARVGFVDAYAVGPGAIQRVEDSRIAFTIFLQEGYQYSSLPEPPSRVGLEAIMTAVFETIYRQARKSATPEPARLLPHLSHLCLTPFMGSVEAERFIAAQQARAGGRSGRRRGTPAHDGAGRTSRGSR
jgi:AcrR family transcriptional regulator